MLRERWGWILSATLFAYFTQLSTHWFYGYILYFFALSETVLFVGLSIITVAFAGLVYHSMTKADNGSMKASELARDNKPAIPLQAVTRIVREGDGFPSTVFTAKGEVRLHIADREFAKLARTNLNQWNAKGREITVTAGEMGQALQIRYRPRGKYWTYSYDSQKAVISYVGCAALALDYYFFKFGLTPFLLAAAAGYLLVSILQFFYRKVALSVEGDKILLKDENKVEHVLLFADIAAVEKGLFRVKVTAKNGEVLYFPRGFVLLPELIEEFAGPLADRK